MTPEEIFRACQHPGPRDSYYGVQATGETLRACWRCGNDAQAAYRAQRKAELAARPKDCARCGARPHTWTYGGYKLCGRCKTLTAREHSRAMAQAGTLAIFATGLLTDTKGWAINQSKGEGLT